MMAPQNGNEQSPLTPVRSLIYLDKCAVCGKPGSKQCSGCALVFYCSPEHQRKDWSKHKSLCRPNSIQQVEGIGRCLMASKVIPADTIVVAEYPISIFDDGGLPRNDVGLDKLLTISDAYLYPCPGCDGRLCPLNLHHCSKCGLPLCSLPCEEGQGHSKDCENIQAVLTKNDGCLWPAFSPTRTFEDLLIFRIILEEKKTKGETIDFKNRKWSDLLKLASEKVDLAEVISLKSPHSLQDKLPLSRAAVEDGGVVPLLEWTLKNNSAPLYKRKRGLYSKLGFLTHSCAPNTEWWIDGEDLYYKLFVRVIKPIGPGERLTINRGDPGLLFLPTLERRLKLLKDLHLNCSCPRCLDPTEKGSCLSGVRCTICKDSLSCNYYFPTNPLDKRTTWTCSGRSCKATKSFEQILVIVMKAEKELNSIRTSNDGNGSQLPAETIISKLQDFLVKHQRKVLHPQHYLVLTARSRVKRICSYFLGCPQKMFLCVVTDLPRAYDYCTYLVEYLVSYHGFLMKLYDGHNEKTIGKVKVELSFAEAALLFQDFNQERMGGSSFFRRLHSVFDNLSKCQEALSPYSECKELAEECKQFSQMLRNLFGSNFLSSYRLKNVVETSEEAMRGCVKEAIGNWKVLCQKIGLLKIYTNPESNSGAGGVGTDKRATKEDLHKILMDIPETNIS